MVLSAEFKFTVSFFGFCLFINAYEGNAEIINSNKEIDSVFKFTILCHVIVYLLAGL